MTKYLSILLLVLSLLSCGESGPVLPPDITAQHKSAAAQMTGLTFPSSANFLLFDYSEGMDDAMWVKVEISSKDIQAFLAQSVFANAQWSSENRRISDMPDVAEWSPSKVPSFRSEQFDLPNAEVLNVMLDERDANKTVVYLMWHQT